jgi:uridylate kinase
VIDGTDRGIRILKLGGSLLDLPDLAGVLRRWLAGQPAAFDVVLVGGGRLADALRDYDRLHGLSDSQAHWLAIRAMELNGRLLAALLPEAAWLDSLEHGTDGVERLAILNPYHFLREDELSASPLPAGWQVTSDSVAARAAEHSGAGELVLLKSALPPDPATLAGAVAAGYVDATFPDASGRLPRIRCVNLREPTFPEVVWAGGTPS